jgi:hypothetical protein
MIRVPSREELSRTLAMYGAFTASGRILDGDDQDTLEHLRRLRAKLTDERGKAIDRVIRGLEAIIERSAA